MHTAVKVIPWRGAFARQVGRLATRVYGSDVPVAFQRLVRFLYCPWIGRGAPFTGTILLSGTNSKFELDTQFYVDWQIWCYGTQDFAVEAAIRSRLTMGGIFIDVGANSGYFACLAATLGARTHAFEPVTRMYAKLERTRMLNPELSIVCHKFGCSDSRGTVQISVPDDADPNWGQSSILRPVGGKTELIELTTIDEFFRASSEARVSMIKIDVEGAEHLVLRGATEVTASQKPLIIFEANDESTGECYDLLHRAGYSTKQLSRYTRDCIAIPQNADT